MLEVSIFELAKWCIYESARLDVTVAFYVTAFPVCHRITMRPQGLFMWSRKETENCLETGTAAEVPARAMMSLSLMVSLDATRRVLAHDPIHQRLVYKGRKARQLL